MGMGRRLLAVLLGVVVWAVPQPAAACGGTFCDGSGPVPMPVDQTGENILFIQDGPAIEAHIQIQYTGEPQRFAWVVPVPSIPEFRVGSDLFFRELLRASAPSYVAQPMPPEVCAETMVPWLLVSPLLLAILPVVSFFYLPWIILSLAPGCASESDLQGGLEDPQPATVVYRDSVGAFDITVLQASDADEVTRWLNDNNYNVPPGARAILAQYADENSLFAAVKLVSTAQVDEIHPIVLRYEYGVPCVPLRLTAVAAASDMGVRTFHLGHARTVPQTYRHVLVNPARVDWLNAGANYMQVVSRAVDDEMAGGQAFVTEYAGPSTVAVTNNFYWWGNRAVPAATNAQGAVDFLTNKGLMTCASDGTSFIAPFTVTGVTPPDSCTFFHPLARGLLQDHVPPPAGVTESAYWRNVRAHASAEDLAAFNPEAFMQDFTTRIDQPARRAADTLGSRRYLTRLFTTISPDEMTVDPEFHERSDLPDVPNIQRATSQTRCDGFTTVTLPDGRTVEVPPGATWPTFDAKMPWAMRVEDIPDQTTLTTLAQREADVDRELAAWNSQREPAAQSLRCACTQADRNAPWMWPAAALLVIFRRRSRR